MDPSAAESQTNLRNRVFSSLGFWIHAQLTSGAAYRQIHFGRVAGFAVDVAAERPGGHALRTFEGLT